jgi:hypothetical protein
MTEIGSPATPQARLRRIALGAVLLVLVQAGIGMIVNLEVTIPRHHPGAHPSDYLGGSFRSVGWAIGHGGVALAFHAAFGLALVVIVVGTGIYALRVERRAIPVWSIIAALLVIGAGFNGASYLDFNDNASSLVMALLALTAVGCYSVVMFLLADLPHRSE